MTCTMCGTGACGGQRVFGEVSTAGGERAPARGGAWGGAGDGGGGESARGGCAARGELRAACAEIAIADGTQRTRMRRRRGGAWARRSLDGDTARISGGDRGGDCDLVEDGRLRPRDGPCDQRRPERGYEPSCGPGPQLGSGGKGDRRRHRRRARRVRRACSGRDQAPTPSALYPHRAPSLGALLTLCAPRVWRRSRRHAPKPVGCLRALGLRRRRRWATDGARGGPRRRESRGSAWRRGARGMREAALGWAPGWSARWARSQIR